jgi:hypothetical protein
VRLYVYYLFHSRRIGEEFVESVDAVVEIGKRSQHLLGFGRPHLLSVERLESVADLYGTTANVIDARVQRLERL